MSFLSMNFLLFLAAAVLGYYLIPGRLQWVWLLLFSYLFYLASGTWAAVFILTTTLTTFLGGLCLERADLRLALILRSIENPIPRQKKILKERYRKYKKWITAAVLLINFGILAVLKYRNFAVENISRMFGAPYTPGNLLAYLIGGLAIFLIVRALSEMAVEDPKAGAFSYYAGLQKYSPSGRR